MTDNISIKIEVNVPTSSGRNDCGGKAPPCDKRVTAKDPKSEKCRSYGINPATPCWLPGHEGTKVYFPDLSGTSFAPYGWDLEVWVWVTDLNPNNIPDCHPNEAEKAVFDLATGTWSLIGSVQYFDHACSAEDPLAFPSKTIVVFHEWTKNEVTRCLPETRDTDETSCEALNCP